MAGSVARACGLHQRQRLHCWRQSCILNTHKASPKAWRLACAPLWARVFSLPSNARAAGLAGRLGEEMSAGLPLRLTAAQKQQQGLIELQV